MVAQELTQELVAAAKRGDEAAWETIYHLFSSQLLGFLMMRLSHTDDAADALSETFLRGIEKCSSFRGGPESLRAWMFAISRNVAMDRLRARRRLSPEADVEAAANILDLTAAEVDERLISHQERDAVTLAIRCLPEDDREVLMLRFAHGLSSREVADVVGKRPGAVRMQQMRALQSVAETLER